ncbi:MAG: DUF452 family protein [Heliobacteriaceae bacterium]|jgi:biotin synthesis protein BioG|nr:DUF452 family protein [Heliobacteriaceae bacterium]
MRHHWLNKADNDKLIIFFGGWGYDHKPFEFLDCEDYDVVMFYDYSDISKLPTLNYQLSTINLIAWSMGVFIAYCLKDRLPQFDQKIAINGTPFPVDDEFGIPKRVFDLTLQHARTGLEGKFYKNVTGADYERYLLSPVERSIENRVEELHALSRHPAFIAGSQEMPQQVRHDDLFYDRALIGAQDKIVPAKNQINFWAGRAPYKLLDAGHFPFYNYTNWNDILGSELLCR